MAHTITTDSVSSRWSCFVSLAAVFGSAVAVVLTALATVGAIVYGSMLNLQNNFEKYEVSISH